MQQITKKKMTKAELENEDALIKQLALINSPDFQLPTFSKSLLKKINELKEKDLSLLSQEEIFKAASYLNNDQSFNDNMDYQALINNLLELQELRIDTRDFSLRFMLKKGQFEDLTKEEGQELRTKEYHLFWEAKQKWEQLTKAQEQEFPIKKLNYSLYKLLPDELREVLKSSCPSNQIIEHNLALLYEIESEWEDRKDIAREDMERAADKKFHDMVFISEEEFLGLSKLESELDCSDQTKRGMLLNKIKEEMYQTDSPDHPYLTMMRANGKENYLATMRSYLEESIPLEELPEEYAQQAKQCIARLAPYGMWARRKLAQLEKENPILIVNRLKNNTLLKYLKEMDAYGRRLFQKMLEFELKRPECPDMNKDPVGWDRYYNMSVLLVDQRINELL